jgi:aspartate 1-decarboxylase
MTIEVLKSKIHRVTVTGAELDYIGSITIDRTLMDAANIVAGEKVQVVNVNNGERLETYVIEGAKTLVKSPLMVLLPARFKKAISSLSSVMPAWMLMQQKALSPYAYFPDTATNTLV